MPDITMCSNSTCEHKEKCYRFSATPNEWRQSYAHFSPDQADPFHKCEYFMMLPYTKAAQLRREEGE